MTQEPNQSGNEVAKTPAGQDELVLGVDGGGTKTVAWLASCKPSQLAGQEESVLGRGSAGPSNPQAVGHAKMTVNLNRAIDAAFADAGLKPAQVASAVVALAGSDRQETRRAIDSWAESRRLARSFHVVHDALPVLVAGSEKGWGVALISGTGSLAFGVNPEGQTSRAGGWGYLFGDEGSGYAIGMAGLRDATKAADGRGPTTQLLPALLERLAVDRPEKLVTAIYGAPDGRAVVASLADVVFLAADHGDEVAGQILSEAGAEVAAMVFAVAMKLNLKAGAFPLALSGGVILSNRTLQDRLIETLKSNGLNPEPVSCVAEPVRGAVLLARRMMDNPQANLSTIGISSEN